MQQRNRKKITKQSRDSAKEPGYVIDPVKVKSEKCVAASSEGAGCTGKSFLKLLMSILAVVAVTSYVYNISRTDDVSSMQSQLDSAPQSGEQDSHGVDVTPPQLTVDQTETPDALEPATVSATEDKVVPLFKDKLREQKVELDFRSPPPQAIREADPAGGPAAGHARAPEHGSPLDIGKNDRPSSVKRADKKSDFLPTLQKKIAPKKVFIDGRRIPPVELLPQKPNNSSVRVYLFNDLLSAEECDSLRKVHDRHVSEGAKADPIICFDSIHTLRKHLANVNKSKVKVSPSDFAPGTTCLNATFSAMLKTWLNANWSYSTAFYPNESKFSLIMAQRLKDSMGLMPENGGKFQITSYPMNVGYKGHTDCTIDSTDKRDRVATVLVYLETVLEGGETEFPELGIWVKPKKGRALLWNNMNEDGYCEPMSIHHAAKVKDGHKYILQRWYYYESFSALGKRPPEPALPPRAPGQPRVTCDEYEHGSCRWYDEWNYEHIVEYNQKKSSLL